jgi:hypothetical protein
MAASGRKAAVLVTQCVSLLEVEFCVRLVHRKEQRAPIPDFRQLERRPMDLSAHSALPPIAALCSLMTEVTRRITERTGASRETSRR